jgi:two-component system, LytTR family, response regulator
MINTIVADDERHARTRLITLLGDYPGIHIIGEIADGDELIPLLQSTSIDAAFLDINMPGKSVFKTIETLPRPPLIVFQTAYPEYAVDAFTIEALDYLMKPVSRERLHACVTKIKKAMEQRGREPDQSIERVTVKYGNIMKVIDVPEIFAISTEEGFSYIYTAEGKFLSDRSLNYFEDILASSGFCRVSRAAIVNLDCVKILHPMFKGSYSLELKNGTKVMVSRRRMKKLKELLGFV